MISFTGAPESTPKPETGTSFYHQTLASNSTQHYSYTSSLCPSFTSPPGLRIQPPHEANFAALAKSGSSTIFAAFAAHRHSLPHCSGFNSFLPGLQTIPDALWEPLPHPRPPSSMFSLFLLRVFHCARCAHSQNVFRSFRSYAFQLHWSRPLWVPWDPHPPARPVAPRPLQNTCMFPSKSKISLTFPSPFVLGFRRFPNNYYPREELRR